MAPNRDLATGRPIGEPLTGHTGPVAAVACATLDDRPVAVTGGRDGTLRLWDLAAERCLDRWPLWDRVAAVAISPTGRHIVAAAGWDLAVFTTN